MKCSDCNDTGEITLFTTVSVCISCDLHTIGRYIINNLRDIDEEPHQKLLKPMVNAVIDKESRSLRIFVNNDLYETVIDARCVATIEPRQRNGRTWAYEITHASLLFTIDSTPIMIDDEEYITLELTHKDNHEVS